MKIKSLLLGSAAALIAVSGAKAADPVIVEAEPVEYVRVCDAYGAGYFYIPGTERCLKISGFVRVQYSSNSYHDEWEDTVPPTERHEVYYEATVRFHANEETEWGTLNTKLELNAAEDNNTDRFSTSDGPGDASVGVDVALISLAGFRVGYSDDYWSSHGGYGFYNSNNSGDYNYGQAILFDYTYAADGFTATIGIQDGRSGVAGQPDVYVGADWSGSWGRIFGLYYYDSGYTNGPFAPSGSGGNGAWKVGGSFSLSDYIPGGAIKGWYMADDGDTDYVHGHTWGVSAKMNLSDNWILYSGYSDYNWQAPSGYSYNSGYDKSRTRMNVGVQWDITSSLYARFEYHKINYDNQCTTRGRGCGNYADTRISTGNFGIRINSSF
jgi:hypothetical protein